MSFIKNQKLKTLLFLFLVSACGDGSNIGAAVESQINTVKTRQYIKIASFNIAELGNSDMNKDFKAIAQIINGLDLIVIQEVRDDGGKEAVKAIYNELQPMAKIPYAEPLVIPKAGMGFQAIEGYAFIYRNPVTLDNRYNPPHWFRSQNHDIYGRIPAFVYFKAGTFDFVVAALHLQWRNIPRRKAEFLDVKDWLIEFADKKNTEERDLIIVGDVNRYGDPGGPNGLSDSDIAQHKAPFDVMVDSAHVGKSYRLISLEFLPELNTRFASEDAQSTTVGEDNNLYDQIFISAGVFREHEASPSKFGEDVGVIAYDMEDPWKSQDTKHIKAAISDHRPVWARFRIDLGDDDGLPATKPKADDSKSPRALP